MTDIYLMILVALIVLLAYFSSNNVEVIIIIEPFPFRVIVKMKRKKHKR